MTHVVDNLTPSGEQAASFT